ncbi:MAG TPA: DsrE/DsrF/DrsH-like family protein [Ktedonobacterales bacterium]|nr:DsrE/DsrF/DrsH-like family protein [Ktedonobacterales bacterium]
MSLLVFSGTFDKVLAASTLAVGGAAMDMQVEIFLTNWALIAFRKDAYKTELRVSKDFEEYGPVLREQLLAGKLPSWLDNLKGAKDIGNVKIYACSMTMGLFNLKLEDLEPIVDDMMGIATFVEHAKEGSVTLFI